MDKVLIIGFIFGGGAACLLAFALGPIGRAIGEKIRRSGGALSDEAGAELTALREDVNEDLDAVRHELAELAERVDFTERVIAQNRDPQRLAP